MQVLAWMVFLLAVISFLLCFSVKERWLRVLCVVVWALAFWCTACGLLGPLF